MFHLGRLHKKGNLIELNVRFQRFPQNRSTSTNVSRRLQGEVGQSVFSKNYIAAI